MARIRKMRVSRRGFMKGGAAAGIGGAAALVGLGARDASAQNIRWDREVDVVVIGSGAGGLPAAIAARDLGASVLVVEQNPDIGGMCINSGGDIFLGGGHSRQKAAGIEDSPDLLFRDFTQSALLSTRRNDRSIIRKFADEAANTFEFLLENGVQFEQQVHGNGRNSRVARTIRAERWPIEAERPTRSTHPQGNGGSGVSRNLEKSAKRKGVQFLMKHRMTKIHRERPESGRVLGISAMQVDLMFQPQGRSVNIRARKGVVVSTGGHSGNVEFRRIFDPRLTEEYTTHCGICNPKTADGEIAAMEIGASLWSAPLQTTRTEMGDTTSIGMRFNGGARFPPDSEYFPRAKAVGLGVKDWQGLIMVKENGKRFFDETMSRIEGGESATERFFAAALDWSGDPKRLDGGGPIWAICDDEHVVREGWTVAPPYVEELYYFKADTVEELATRISTNPYQWRPMPGKILRESVDRYNSFVAAGKDADFNKPGVLYKLQRPPFYAFWATPNPNDCHAGIRINANAEVIDMKGQVIPGLYAAGDSASGILLHGIGKAAVFGRVAGISAAQQRPETVSASRKG